MSERERGRQRERVRESARAREREVLGHRGASEKMLLHLYALELLSLLRARSLLLSRFFEDSPAPSSAHKSRRYAFATYAIRIRIVSAAYAKRIRRYAFATYAIRIRIVSAAYVKRIRRYSFETYAYAADAIFERASRRAFSQLLVYEAFSY